MNSSSSCEVAISAPLTYDIILPVSSVIYKDSANWVEKTKKKFADDCGQVYSITQAREAIKHAIKSANEVTRAPSKQITETLQNHLDFCECVFQGNRYYIHHACLSACVDMLAEEYTPGSNVGERAESFAFVARLLEGKNPQLVGDGKTAFVRYLRNEEGAPPTQGFMKFPYKEDPGKGKGDAECEFIEASWSLPRGELIALLGISKAKNNMKADYFMYYHGVWVGISVKTHNAKASVVNGGNPVTQVATFHFNKETFDTLHSGYKENSYKTDLEAYRDQFPLVYSVAQKEGVVPYYGYKSGRYKQMHPDPNAFAQEALLATASPESIKMEPTAGNTEFISNALSCQNPFQIVDISSEASRVHVVDAKGNLLEDITVEEYAMKYTESIYFDTVSSRRAEISVSFNEETLEVVFTTSASLRVSSVSTLINHQDSNSVIPDKIAQAMTDAISKPVNMSQDSNIDGMLIKKGGTYDSRSIAVGLNGKILTSV